MRLVITSLFGVLATNLWWIGAVNNLLTWDYPHYVLLCSVLSVAFILLFLCKVASSWED